MCGIIAVVRRRSRRRGARIAPSILGAARSGLADLARGGDDLPSARARARARRRRRARGRRHAAARGARRARRSLRSPDLARRGRRADRRASPAHDRGARREARRGRRSLDRRASNAINAALVRAEGCARGPSPRTGCAPPKPSPTCSRARARRAADRGVHLGPAGAVARSTASRCAAATRPASTSSSAATASTSSRPAIARAARPARRATRCSASGAVRTPDGHARASSTRRRPRSASWATTPRALRAAIRPTSCCAWRSPPTTPRSRCSATPAGRASASSPGQRPPAQPRGASGGHAGPYVVAALNGDVDNFADLKRPRACASPPRSPPTPR